MMEGCRFLRPLARPIHASKAHRAHARFFNACYRLSKQQEQQPVSSGSDHDRRVALLQERRGLENCYPRLPLRKPNRREGEHIAAWRIRDVKATAEDLEPGSSTDDHVEIYGRVKEIRALSSKLLFIDCEQDGHTVQIVCNRAKIEDGQNAAGTMKDLRQLLRRGDWISACGHPYKTQHGGAALLVSQVPILWSPALHQIPALLKDLETTSRKPHVGMLVDAAETLTLRIRSHIETNLTKWFHEEGFLRVSTPILSSGAGGAMARPFETAATELADTKLSLRIAPELWLKRLVLGGMDKIYEMGPAFRNEGVDSTHNPEFTMCEFYAPFTNLDELITMTENMLASLSLDLCENGPDIGSHLPDSILQAFHKHRRPENVPFQDEIRQLAFIPTLESEMKTKLPDLAGPNTYQDLLRLFKELKLDMPERVTVPAFLDALCGAYIEPLCKEPTFITYHPAALSPLAKSFLCPETKQVISARAELFIDGREYANMYEEENSPFEQRKKFEQQLEYRREAGLEVTGEVDESYLEALEWGLPPTGGWGMGIDRLVMLFTGRKRIGDVLPFGTLRNVVGLQKVDKRGH